MLRMLRPKNVRFADPSQSLSLRLRPGPSLSYAEGGIFFCGTTLLRFTRPYRHAGLDPASESAGATP